MKTYKEVLESYNFHWNSTKEIWIKSSGFGRSSTVDVLFKNLFIIHNGRVKVYDHFIDDLQSFNDIMKENFG
jgi:hypothetical protein